MTQFIVKYTPTEYKSYQLDTILSIMMALSMDIVNISKVDSYYYIIVNSEGSKIKRLEDMCWCYVSPYDRKYVIPDLQKKLESGLINQKKYDREMEGTKDRIRIDILKKEEIELTVAEKRDDTLTDILS